MIMVDFIFGMIFGIVFGIVFIFGMQMGSMILVIEWKKMFDFEVFLKLFVMQFINQDFSLFMNMNEMILQIMQLVFMEQFIVLFVILIESFVFSMCQIVVVFIGYEVQYVDVDGVMQKGIVILVFYVGVVFFVIIGEKFILFDVVFGINFVFCLQF